MAASIKGIGRVLPLWKRRIPRYPVYWSGNPQLRVFLPQFWMKMIKPEREIPSDVVHFVVHPQMSRIDIKNYLEKIYQVPVLSVRTDVHRGKEIKHPIRDHVVALDDDVKYAYVQLGDGCTFEFPDIFKDKKKASEKELAEFKQVKLREQTTEQTHWSKLSLPPWFR
ncbi:39S ribosomal protein L23, mitochondrial-like isoform X2 [Gigantopelta aegis]|uniref:39S ribosomal protein L23, mitochondrial-like isoform X1 n=1 Tax=Gigantopelta aegis TaxID=1735272 RepID=UPI001B889216|nr:39S ribosomal protein L23, mitochondrial-like isoform X1 [Gigantopelta aegis]XP_041354670.1 39S ribosomal protein L23, mitochondrial-like isoform X2 [Gigantopelta aegis]